MRELLPFLRRSLREPFVWGERDCALWVCDWLQCRHGIDPAAHLRGTYDSEMSCRRMYVRGGGIEQMASECFSAAGMVETTRPATGDVGAVVASAGTTLAIKTQSQWAMKAPAGVTLGNPPVLKAWTFGG